MAAKQKLAGVSPLVFAAACVLLTLIISVFAFNNYKREKQHMMDTMIRHSENISRFLANGMRLTIRHELRRGTFSLTDIPAYLQEVIEQANDQRGVQSIIVADRKGSVLAASETLSMKRLLPEELADFMLKSSSDTAQELYFRVVQAEKSQSGGEEGSFFQIVRPLFFLQNEIQFEGGRLRGPGGRKQNERFEQLFQIDTPYRGGLLLFVEIDLGPLQAGVNRQLFEIIALSIVLLLVGLGGWLSLFTLQGYKGTRSRLKNLEVFNDLLISSLPLGLIACDRGEHIMVCNASLFEIFDLPEKSYSGKPLRSVLPEQLHGHVFDVMKKDNYQTDIIYKSEKKQKKHLYIQSHDLYDELQQYAGKVILFQDRTDIKEMEQSLQRNQRYAALGKVAAGVAHELRNPLSSIKGLATLVQSKLVNPSEDLPTVKLMISEIERLDRAITEMMDFARPFKLEKRNSDLGLLMQRTVELLHPDMMENDITLQLKQGEQLETLIDEDKIQQVFLNILLNAIQAMERGGTLRIDQQITSSGILTEVADSGSGIPKDTLESIIDPYFTTKSDGTGLGLAISSKIIEDHGGNLHIDSTLGKGTTVSVYFPLSPKSD